MASRIFIDAGVFIGALLRNDTRNAEAYPLVEAARRGDMDACTSVGVISEVYGALTWSGSSSPLTPIDAAVAVALLIEPPSRIQIIGDNVDAALLCLQLATRHTLTARRIHDARHAATALSHKVEHVFTYDPEDWRVFTSDGIIIDGPATTLARL